jgi:hypothetical protein
MTLLQNIGYPPLLVAMEVLNIIVIIWIPKLIYKWDWLMYNTCLAKGNTKRMLYGSLARPDYK